MKTECWAGIPGWEFYEASNAGRIRSLPRTVAGPNGPMRLRGKVLRPGKNSDGYRCVNLYSGGIKRSAKVSHLVAETFLGDRAGRFVDHRNRIRTDDRLENLRFATRAENVRNSKIRKDSRARTRGIRRIKSGRIIARIRKDGVRAHLGTFDSIAAAKAAYKAAAARSFVEFAP